MYLMFYLDENGKRVYTLKKFDPTGKPTISSHPARFSPEDKFSQNRIIVKKRFGLLPTQQAKKFVGCFIDQITCAVVDRQLHFRYPVVTITSLASTLAMCIKHRKKLRQPNLAEKILAEVQPGDVLCLRRPQGARVCFKHWAIFVGRQSPQGLPSADDWLVDFSGTNSRERKATARIRWRRLADAIEQSPEADIRFCCENPGCACKIRAVARAIRAVGRLDKYWLLLNNCEHFCYEVVHGKKFSAQATAATVICNFLACAVALFLNYLFFRFGWYGSEVHDRIVGAVGVVCGTILMTWAWDAYRTFATPQVEYHCDTLYPTL